MLMAKNVIKHFCAVAMLFCIASLAWAEDAPVYDSDNYPPAFDESSEGGLPIANEQGYTASEPPLSTQQRIAKVEQQINNLQHTNPSAKLEVLQNEIQVLRNQVEELSHALQQMQTQQKTMYTDVDNRIQQLGKVKASKPLPGETVTSAQIPIGTGSAKVLSNASKTAVTSEVHQAAPAAKTESQPNPTEEQQTYQTAYDLIKAKKYNDAIAALQKMLQKYPRGQFAANAHYWLGELYGLLNKNDQSAAEFSIVADNYPDSAKASDAELKLGLIYVAQFKWSEAKAAFQKVISRSPRTASARLASEQLRQIRKAGH